MMILNVIDASWVLITFGSCNHLECPKGAYNDIETLGILPKLDIHSIDIYFRLQTILRSIFKFLFMHGFDLNLDGKDLMQVDSKKVNF